MLTKPRDLKYGTALIVFVIIDVVFSLIGVFGMLGLAELANPETKNEIYLVVALTVVLVVLMIVAATKVKQNKSWNMFLFILFFLVIVLNIANDNILGLILPGIAIIFSILNLMDAKDRDIEIAAQEAALREQKIREEANSL